MNDVFHFIGKFEDLPAFGNNIGDVVIVKNKEFIWDGKSGWQCISQAKQKPQQQAKPQVPKRMFCKYCGAPVRIKKEKCEYCGMEYEFYDGYGKAIEKEMEKLKYEMQEQLRLRTEAEIMIEMSNKARTALLGGMGVRY